MLLMESLLESDCLSSIYFPRDQKQKDSFGSKFQKFPVAVGGGGGGLRGRIWNQRAGRDQRTRQTLQIGRWQVKKQGNLLDWPKSSFDFK